MAELSEEKTQTGQGKTSQLYPPTTLPYFLGEGGFGYNYNKNISTHWKASDAIEPLVLQTTKEQTKWVAKITGLQIQRSNYIIKHIQPDITCCCHQSST